MCRPAGVLSVPGVYGGLLDKVPFGMAMNKGLTIRTGQTHVLPDHRIDGGLVVAAGLQAASSRVLRAGDRHIAVDGELENVWSGKKDAKTALDDAVKAGNEQLKRFEAANK